MYAQALLHYSLADLCHAHALQLLLTTLLLLGLLLLHLLGSLLGLNLLQATFLKARSAGGVRCVSSLVMKRQLTHIKLGFNYF